MHSQAINDNGQIIVVDSVSPTVFRITENGELIKWFDVSNRMREPSDLAVHGKEFFICDFKVATQHLLFFRFCLLKFRMVFFNLCRVIASLCLTKTVNFADA